MAALVSCWGRHGSVERAWQELVNQSGGNGVPLVTELEDFEAMEAGTARTP